MPMSWAAALIGNGAEAAVTDLGMPGTPDDIDRKIGSEAEADGGAQALRPGSNRAKWRARPVTRPDECSYFGVSA